MEEGFVLERRGCAAVEGEEKEKDESRRNGGRLLGTLPDFLVERELTVTRAVKLRELACGEAFFFLRWRVRFSGSLRCGFVWN